MANSQLLERPARLPRTRPAPDLAASITRAASKQTYYTVRFLVDRDLVPDAYRAYAYFRWVDDRIDSNTGSQLEKITFVARQRSLLDACYRRETPDGLCAEEQMLADLVATDGETDSGLQAYLRNMMALMVFDVERRGRLISQAELAEYSRLLATAVMEALLYFIGHRCSSPYGDARYLAVKGAHIVHMLRDMAEDIDAGYYNVPVEAIEGRDLTWQDTARPSFREWVASRVELACRSFKEGREYLSQVHNFRCRLASYAYIARFEWMARTIMRDGYRLRRTYPERKSLRAALWMVLRTLESMPGWFRLDTHPSRSAMQMLGTER